MQQSMLAESHQGFYNRLTKVHKHLGKLASKRGITCYRLYDKDMPEHPVIIDVYEDHAVLYEYKSKHKLSDEQYEFWLQHCALATAQVLDISLENVHVKMRKRIIEREQQYQKNETDAQYFIVQEDGLSFYTNYDTYLDTGLFIDHRLTRQMVRKQADGKRVLNLFCYTGSFSVYAAAGAAKEVWSLDLSNTYIDWAKRNALLNNCEHQCAMKFMKCDVLQALHTLPHDYFDIIVSDPPTFSNSKMMKNHWDVQEHHGEHLRMLKTLLRHKGIVYFSNNHRDFMLDHSLHADFEIADITKQTTDFDFVGKLKRPCFLLQKP
jgi:23S rRNA (cytosine1962-C5)-methyltransferase